jgi:Brp/Blh family beta-carotene 15,15'-monooxygenase
MLLYLIIWWIIPIAGLVIFFGISIHHFGQSNFENTKLLYLPSILWGIWVLLFPVLLHSQEAITIFQQMLLSNNFRFQFIQYPITDLFKIITLGIFTFLYFIVLKIFEPQSLFKYFFQFLIVTFWYLLTPLLFGFIIFFCLWHSLQSLKHQSHYFLKLSKANLKEFIIKMIPFSAVALGFFGIYIYYRGFILSEAFILLSILTFPHVLIMDKLYKKSSAFLHTTKN